jgi:hypothetical protein
MRDNLFPQRDYELHLYDSSGKEAPLTKWGSQIRTYIHGSGYDITLAPGEKLTDKEDLSSVYAVSVVGTYTLDACRAIHGWGNLYSNKLVLPVIEAPPAAK